MSLAAALFGAVACEDVLGIIEEFGGDTSKLTEISINPASVTIKAEGGQASIAFEAPSTWSATSTENWIDIDPAIGTSGEVVVTITARPNTDAERRATVTVESGKLKATATVIQEGVGGTTQPEDSTAVNPPVVDPGTVPADAVWSIVGTVGGYNWDTDMPMVHIQEINTGRSYWYGVFYYKIGEELKLRANGGWEFNRGFGPVTTNDAQEATFNAVQGGANITFDKQSVYELCYYPDTETISVRLPYNQSWSLIGTMSGQNWDVDNDMLPNIREDSEGKTHIYFCGQIDYIGEEFKIRFNRAWEFDFGLPWDAGTTYSASDVIPLVVRGTNITISGVKGKYYFYFDPLAQILWLEDENGNKPQDPQNPPQEDAVWSVIGTINGTNWDTDFDMDCGGDFYHYTLYYEDGQEFKFRQNHRWGDPDYGYGPIIMPDPSVLDGVQGGPNITLPWTGYWDLYLTPSTGQIQFYPWLNGEWQYFKNPDGSVANVTFYSDSFGHAVTGKVKYYEVNGVRTCLTETNGKGVLGESDGRDWFFVWYTDSDRIKLPIQYSGFVDSNYGEAMVFSPYYYYGVLCADKNPDLGTYWDFIQNYPSQPECYYDGNGGFYFGVEWYLFVESRLGYHLSSYDVLGEADGFVRKDYSGDIYVGSPVEGVRDITFTVGRDISSVRYVFFDEKIDDEDKATEILQQLLEGTINYSTLDQFTTENGKDYYGVIKYAADVPGYHTIVSAGMDAEGNCHFWYYWWFYLDPYQDPSGYTWSPMGAGTYTEDFIASLYSGAENLTWNVEIEKCNDDPSRIRMVYPYDGKYEYNEEGDWATDKSYDIEIMIPDEDHVYILPQETGMDWGKGMISIASLCGYSINNGAGIDEIAATSFGTLKDGVITFPTKGLLITYETAGGWYYANSNGAFKLVLPGAEVGGSEGTAGGDGTGAAGVAKKSVKKAAKQMVDKSSGNGAGGKYVKPRPALERAN